MPGGTSTEATTSADSGGSTCGAATERCWRCFPRVLTRYGESGRFFGDVVGNLPASTFDRPRVRATGQAATCTCAIPFSSTGRRGRIAECDGVDVSPVERAILDGLGVPALRL